MLGCAGLKSNRVPYKKHDIPLQRQISEWYQGHDSRVVYNDSKQHIFM